MGYSLHTDTAPRKRTPGVRPARPKTHTRGPQLQQRFRYYKPDLGRWTSRDPIGYDDGPNQYALVGNSPNNFVDEVGLMMGRVGPPLYAPEIISRESLEVFGRTPALLVENDCTCACGRGTYELSCTMSVQYQILLAAQNSLVWQRTPESYPSDPTPPDWSAWDYTRKRANSLAHERRHVSNFRNWYDRRRSAIEAFEQLVYPTKQGCDQRAANLKLENETQWRQKYTNESNHVGW